MCCLSCVGRCLLSVVCCLMLLGCCTLSVGCQLVVCVLLFAAWCVLLFVVCFVVDGSSCAVGCLAFDCRLLSVVCRLRCVGCCVVYSVFFAVCCSLFVGCLLFAVCCVMFVVCWLVRAGCLLFVVC